MIQQTLQEILIEQLSQLETLNELLNIKYQLLIAGKVNLLRLNEVTEKKQYWLTALHHSDEKRITCSQQGNCLPPYQQDKTLAPIWQKIELQIKHLYQHNSQNGLLLKQHMQINQEQLTFLKKRHSPALYGEHGQTENVVASGYRIKI
ncbi:MULTISPECIES: flagellar export chaperone FlgN [unclassified Arsenophonus]|uniref:flagella synthesis protein FlgN n=1 Tax=unclassified Arsenophonus TaxID=2627083 RepID=UPI00285B95F9|nr:flagellar export chaperone FlgN [Arsenophonus sp.]MDR5610739.1 flagellar export chaperone FlgN [Arsenophonus sp.]MDR5614498.1 flagellar export chaperone FlgN [Arsenophonus sp.]